MFAFMSFSIRFLYDPGPKISFMPKVNLLAIYFTQTQRQNESKVFNNDFNCRHFSLWFHLLPNLMFCAKTLKLMNRCKRLVKLKTLVTKLFVSYIKCKALKSGCVGRFGGLEGWRGRALLPNMI